MDFIAQIALIFILVLLNGFFVASEFALISVRKTRIDELVNRGSASAKLVQKSIAHLDTFISATQLGITLASLALGWAGEPTIAHFLEPLISKFLPNPAAILSSHGLSIAIAFGIITFLHIILGELAPKTIALQRAERTALLVIGPLSFFTTLFKPFIWVLNGAGNLVLKIVGLQAPSGHQLVHSEEEIKMILAQSAEEGAIEKQEAEMVYSVLRLGDIPINKIMIPKSSVIAFDMNTPIKEVISTAEINLHSRFPIYQGNLNNIIGFIHIKDVYKLALNEARNRPLKEIYFAVLRKNTDKKIAQANIIRQILKVGELRKVDDVILDMRKERIHIAVVLNKKQNTIGIVTLEDTLESLVGEIHDEFEKKSKRKKSILRRTIS